MRTLAPVVLVAAGVLLMTPQPADAQGFWRFFERLSGPEISGPGFDVVLFCYGVQIGEEEPSPFVDPQCGEARRDRVWISGGSQFYLLAGDNNLTQDPFDRVDATGVVPFVDVNLPWGVAVGAGVGVRHYSAGAESFNKPVFEAAVKVRPIRSIARLRGRSSDEPRFLFDFLELRGGLVYQGAFEAGRFGRGSAALDGDVGYVLFLAFNPVQ